MAVLNDCNYKNLARILLERIGEDEFFNGTVFLEADGVELSLRATLLVYRDKNGCRNDPGGLPKQIVPVWYGCEVMENGKIIANEFSWKEFKKFLPVNG